MQANSITLVVIPQKTSGVIRLRVSRFFIRCLCLLAGLFLIFAGVILVHYFQIRDTRDSYQDLLKTLMIQKIKTQEIHAEVQKINKKLVKFEEFDRKLRVIIDAPNFPSSGIGLYGSENTEQLRDRLQAVAGSIQTRETSFFKLESYLQDQKDRLARTPSVAPVKASHITSSYGIRIDPFTGRPRQHNGLDWAGRPKTPIYAPADGLVTGAFVNGGYGNFMVIDHGYKIITRYAHLSEFVAKVGQRVKRGDVIAKMGNTGRSTATHLHYEVLVRGIPVNPAKYILDLGNRR